MSHIFQNIKKLEEKVRYETPKYDFNARLHVGEIETFERAHGIIFPESYKQFLERFNGGMITRYKWTSYVDMCEYEAEHPSRDSFRLFRLEELIDKYTNLRLDDWLLEDVPFTTYPIIPICRTPNEDLIFVVSNKGLDAESPVFASFELKGNYICQKVAADFNVFLGYYMESEGFPALLPDDIEPSFEAFMEANNVKSMAMEKLSHEDTILRATELIKQDPKDVWAYCTRGTAYHMNGNPKLALIDLNKTIELDDKESFFYHCRGDLILEFGSARKALIDLDIAVKLEPDNLIFMTRRADALGKLGKYKKALNDCNKVLTIDPLFEFALFTRVDIYKALGEDEKAKIDSDLIDELNS